MNSNDNIIKDNKKPEAIIINLLSEKVNGKIKRYNVAADHSNDNDFYRCVGEARKHLDMLKQNYDLMTPEEYAERHHCKVAASRYVGFQFVIGYCVASINKHAPKLVKELCNKAWDVEARVHACHELNGACSNGCAHPYRPYCEHGYFCKYKSVAVFVYDFLDAKMHKICGKGMPADSNTASKWEKLVLDTRQKYFDGQAYDNKDSEYSVKFKNLLSTPTPWLGVTNLYELYTKCQRSWARFMDVVNTTTEAINSEGVWDVELGTSHYAKEGSTHFTTTDAENGSITLSPRRGVVVRVPKYHDVIDVLDYDRVMLFLELTFYKYAGIKPMLPVIQVSAPDGGVDYAVDYSRDSHFEEEDVPSYEEEDIADLTYFAHYGDGSLEDDDDFEEIDRTVDWDDYGDESFGLRTAEATGTDTTVSLLVTDDREAKPFSFKINFLEELTPVETTECTRVHAVEFARKQDELYKELEAQGKLTAPCSAPVVTHSKRVSIEERVDWALSDYKYHWMMMNKVKDADEFYKHLNAFLRTVKLLKKLPVDIQAVSTEYGISRAALNELINR